jgi:hypothetical protein
MEARREQLDAGDVEAVIACVRRLPLSANMNETLTRQ